MLTLLFTGILLSAQNIGIGNSNPAEKLDVNGNINVTGTIKANGTDGLPQQVLMKNSSGALTWGSICDYKNFSMFVLSGSFIIPAGVTKVAVEIWGGAGNIDIAIYIQFLCRCASADAYILSITKMQAV